MTSEGDGDRAGRPPTDRFPSYTERYAPGFGVMVVCWALYFLLLIILMVVKGLFAVMDGVT